MSKAPSLMSVRGAEARGAIAPGDNREGSLVMPGVLTGFGIAPGLLALAVQGVPGVRVRWSSGSEPHSPEGLSRIAQRAYTFAGGSPEHAADLRVDCDGPGGGAGRGLGWAAGSALGGARLAGATSEALLRAAGRALQEHAGHPRSHAICALAQGGLHAMRNAWPPASTRLVWPTALHIGVVIPGWQGREDLRRYLPQSVSLRRAAAHMGELLATWEAAQSGDIERFAQGLVDPWTEEHLLRRIPGALPAAAQARAAGALHVGLSSRGPSVVVLAAGADTLAEAMESACRTWAAHSIPTQSYAVSAVTEGAA